MLNSILLQTGADNGLGNILMIVGIFVVFYFFMIRPQQKRQKEIKKFREGVQVGDKVVTAGGIYGKVREVNDTTFVLEIAKDVKITIDKGSVYQAPQQAAEDPNKK